METVYRHLPAVHRLLATQTLQQAEARYGRDAVVAACRETLAELREKLAAGSATTDDLRHSTDDVAAAVVDRLAAADRDAYAPVVNATGVMIHTNLGRSPLAQPMPAALASYLALEYDLAAGARGQRLAPLRARIARVFGSESAVMVNNNAAAVFLLMSAIAKGREVVISRSQLIEIGGSFRLPSVMAASGALMVEVGCTNRTHLADYAAALNDQTAAILVAHQSNFRIVGFTTNPSIAELATLAHEHDLPLLVDQGSGALHDMTRWGFPHEETVAELLEMGADAVCFSGDKLLGGPQAGVIVGAERWVEPLGRHPLYRALRPDKTALLCMDHVLRAHSSGRLSEIPLYAALETPLSRLKIRAQSIGRRLRSSGIPVRGRSTRAVLGGGTTPEHSMPSHGLSVDGGQRLADALRRSTPPVIGRLEADEVILDLRTVFPAQDRLLETAIREAYQGGSERQEAGR